MDQFDKRMEKVDLEAQRYASDEKPWLKFYPYGAEEITVPKNNLFSQVMNNNSNRMNETLMEYYGKKIPVYFFGESCKKLSSALKVSGIEQGMSVPIIGAPTPESVYTLFGSHILGATSDELSPAFSNDVMYRKLMKTNSDILFVLDALYPKYKEVIEDSKPHIKKVVIFSPQESFFLGKKGKIQNKKDERQVTWREFVSSGRKEINNIDTNRTPGEREPLCIVYSSGTTGDPKGIMLGAESFLSMWQMYKNTGLPINKGDKFLHVIPFNHSTGINNSLIMVMLFGGTVILDPPYDAKRFGESLIKHKPFFTIAPTSHFEALLSDPAIHSNGKLKLKRKTYDVDLSSIKYPFTAGEEITPKVEAELNKLLQSKGAPGQIEKTYGQSEGGPALSTTIGDAWYSPQGSSGKPLPGVDISVFDMETFAEKEIGQRGMIWYKTPARMIGYKDQPSETLSHFRKLINHQLVPLSSLEELNNPELNIWGNSGDIGMVDENGDVFIYGREENKLIDTNGNPIYKFDIAAEIKKHPAVLTCEIAGIKTSAGVEQPFAHILLDPSQEYNELEVIEEINHICKTNLSENSVPVGYKIRESFKKNSSGKRYTEILSLELDGYYKPIDGVIYEVSVNNERDVKYQELLSKDVKVKRLTSKREEK